MIDPYAIFERERMSVSSWRQPPWDVFISAFDDSDRVRNVFSLAHARTKVWLLLPEYHFSQSEQPSGGIVVRGVGREDDVVTSCLSAVKLTPTTRLCIDATGFIAPYLMFLVQTLFVRGIHAFDVLYSDPISYQRGEDTTFMLGEPHVRQVLSFEGQHVMSTKSDLLLVGVGFDPAAATNVADFKPHSQKAVIYGLPSLQADMYQQSVLRADAAAEALGIPGDARVYFAPANDPFATASVVRSIVEETRRRYSLDNLYLAPLATKAQALGFALYWLRECKGVPASILFPFAKKHARSTATGLSRISRYRVEN